MPSFGPTTGRLNPNPTWPFWLKGPPQLVGAGATLATVTVSETLTFAESADRAAQSFTRPVAER
jgi:hypothetical protein